MLPLGLQQSIERRKVVALLEARFEKERLRDLIRHRVVHQPGALLVAGAVVQVPVVRHMNVGG